MDNRESAGIGNSHNISGHNGASESSKKSSGYEVSKVSFAKHENKNMVEVTVNGILIAKNRDDNLINIVQILNLAGLSEEEMNNTLNSEISNDQTVIDDGKYKGIWIKTNAALGLIEKLGLEEVLEPVIREQDIDRPKKSRTLSRTYSTLTENDEYTDKSMMLNDDSAESPTKKLKNAANGKEYDTLEMTTKYALEPLDISGIPNYDQYKEMLTQIFISENGSVAEACNQLKANHVDLDLPIDPQGNTVLHWAASLANVSLVHQLVSLGASLFRGNNNGETALMRAVAHINYLEDLSFGKLLDILYPSVVTLDNKRRSVVHHIVLTAGIEGRSDAAKYYLQCLVEWIIKNSPRKAEAISLSNFMNSIVNLKDTNGDTALNIIARIGNKAIAQQLLDVGADPKIANKAGLTPSDFRISGFGLPDGRITESKVDSNEQISSILEKPNKAANNEALIEAFETDVDGGSNKNSESKSKESMKKISTSSAKILGLMQTMMSQLNSNFENELKTKQTEINQLYKELKESTLKLTQSRSQLELLKNSESKLNELKQKTSNVEKSIQEEETKFNSQHPEAASQAFDINTSYDPDQPFKVPSIYYEVKSQLDNHKRTNPQSSAPEIDLSLLQRSVNPNEIPPAYVLKARIKAYKENEKFLLSLVNNLDQKSIILENKFRHVVSLCTGVNEDKVDDLLEGLVEAVESDPDEVDLGRVAGFLTKVDDDM